MQKKILVVGSGTNSQLDASEFDLVYAANSSFARLENYSSISLVLSEAMLYTPELLANHDPIPGMSREASDSFRLSKYSLIDNHSFDKIFVIGSSQVNAKLALERKNVIYNRLEEVGYSQLWKLIDSCFNFWQLLAIMLRIPGLSSRLTFLMQRILGRRMSLRFRPSTGLSSIMLAVYENPGAAIFTSGINIRGKMGERVGKYPFGNIEYSQAVHALDHVYYSFLVDEELEGSTDGG